MMEFYPQIKLAHIALVMLSGMLFALRGAAALAGQAWPRMGFVRWGCVTIDSALLTTAAMLAGMLPHAVFANGWLAVKLVCVVVYIVLGILAMRQAWPRRRRAIAYVAALAIFATIVGIARMHSPWGWFAHLHT